MKKLLGEWAVLAAVGVGLAWVASITSAWPLRNYLWGLLLCYVIVGVNNVRRWRYERELRKFAKENMFFVRLDDTTPGCTCKTQHYGGLCRIHVPFFF